MLLPIMRKFHYGLVEEELYNMIDSKTIEVLTKYFSIDFKKNLNREERDYIQYISFELAKAIVNDFGEHESTKLTNIIIANNVSAANVGSTEYYNGWALPESGYLTDQFIAFLAARGRKTI